MTTYIYKYMYIYTYTYTYTYSPASGGACASTLRLPLVNAMRITISQHYNILLVSAIILLVSTTLLSVIATILLVSTGPFSRGVWWGVCADAPPAAGQRSESAPLQ